MSNITQIGDFNLQGTNTFFFISVAADASANKLLKKSLFRLFKGEEIDVFITHAMQKQVLNPSRISDENKNMKTRHATAFGQAHLFSIPANSDLQCLTLDWSENPKELKLQLKELVRHKDYKDMERASRFRKALLKSVTVSFKNSDGLYEKLKQRDDFTNYASQIQDIVYASAVGDIPDLSFGRETDYYEFLDKLLDTIIDDDFSSSNNNPVLMSSKCAQKTRTLQLAMHYSEHMRHKGAGEGIKLWRETYISPTRAAEISSTIDSLINYRLSKQGVQNASPQLRRASFKIVP